jgi:hypothetical protein
MDKMKIRGLFVHTALQARTPPIPQKKKCEGEVVVVVDPITLAGILLWITTTTTTCSSGCTRKVFWQEAEEEEVEQLQRGKPY